MDLEIKFIRTDGGTQARARLDPETVDEYRDAFRDSDGTWPFPPVVVFHDGSAYWLADGFHRIAAARLHGRFVCEADVRQGTQRDAVLFAAGANADHGLRRTNDDKRRAVLRLLEDAEWGQWSDREIARRCQVSHPFVGAIRAELKPVTGHDSSERKYTTKHGTVTTMRTEAIGKNTVNGFSIQIQNSEAEIVKGANDGDTIYILRGDRHCKIGFTTNLVKRYKTLASSPDVKLIHAFRGSREDEAKLHKLFSPYRVSGEWFDLPENIISSLMGITSSDQLSDLEESGDLSENDWETAVMKTGNIGGNGTAEKKLPPKPEVCPECAASLETDASKLQILGQRADLDATCTGCGREYHWFSFFGAVAWTHAYTRASDNVHLTAAEQQTQLTERAYYWLAEYTDQWERTWRELEPNQVHHANSPCYQAFVRQFPSDRDHKSALKNALARLEQENLAGVPETADALLRAHAAKGSRSAESVYRTLASFDASGHEYAMGLAIEDTGLSPSDIRQAAAELLTELAGVPETAVSPAPIETYNGTAYQRETITNAHGQTETRWEPVNAAPSLIDGPLNQMRQALSLMKFPGDHARAFRQWQQAPDTKREDGMMFGAIARLIEILVDELEADREVPMT